MCACDGIVAGQKSLNNHQQQQHVVVVVRISRCSLIMPSTATSSRDSATLEIKKKEDSVAYRIASVTDESCFLMRFSSFFCSMFYQYTVRIRLSIYSFFFSIINVSLGVEEADRDATRDFASREKREERRRGIKRGHYIRR
jgi:hypothetical protein